MSDLTAHRLYDRHRWNDAIRSAPYKTLDANARHFAHLLATHMSPDGSIPTKFTPSQGLLARELGWNSGNRWPVIRAVEALETWGYLIVERKGQRCFYFAAIPEMRVAEPHARDPRDRRFPAQVLCPGTHTTGSHTTLPDADGGTPSTGCVGSHTTSHDAPADPAGVEGHTTGRVDSHTKSTGDRVGSHTRSRSGSTISPLPSMIDTADRPDGTSTRTTAAAAQQGRQNKKKTWKPPTLLEALGQADHDRFQAELSAIANKLNAAGAEEGDRLWSDVRTLDQRARFATTMLRLIDNGWGPEVTDVLTSPRPEFAHSARTPYQGIRHIGAEAYNRVITLGERHGEEKAVKVSDVLDGLAPRTWTGRNAR